MADGLASGVRDELTRVLAPLASAAATPGGAVVLLGSLGHPDAVGADPSVRAEVERVAALAGALSGLPDADLRTWEGLARVAELADEVLTALRDLDAVLPPSAQGAGQELTERLLAQYLREYRPHLFRLAAALTVITPAERADPEPLLADPAAGVTRMPWARDRLHVDRLAALFDDAPAVLAAGYLPGAMGRAAEAHQGAAALFPVLGDLASGLGLAWFTDLLPLTPAPPPAAEEDEPPDPEFPDEDEDEPPEADPADPGVVDRAFLPRLAVYLLREEDGQAVQSRFALTVVASSAEHPGGVRGYRVTPLGEVGWAEERGDWRIALASAAEIPAFVVGPGGLRAADGDRIAAAVTVDRLGDASFVVGPPEGTRVEIAALGFTARAESSPDRNALEFSASAGSAVAVLAAEEGDGFLGLILPEEGIRIPFELTVALSTDRGLELRGGAGLELSLPADRRIGPVTVRRIRVRVDGSPAFTVTGDLDVALGPLTVSVADLGLRLELSGPPDPVSVGARLELPSALGVAIDAAPVTGAGVIAHDPATGRYGGALAMRLGQVGVRGIALLDTRLPGSRRGFSLLVMLSARLPGIQLGFGVTLTGVGGLVGINRRIDVDALKERYENGAAARLLGAEDPARDLPALLTDLSAVFPPADGVYVVGPTAQLQWLRLVTLDVGLFLEFPGPTRVVLLGTARASLDNPLAQGPLLRLRADFVGVLDLARETLAFDAVLVDSRLLESFPVTGGMLLRASWGDDPYTLLSVGGFHPDFAPGSLPVPKTLTRLAMSSGSPDDRLYLRFEGYFAITTNTLQFGASVEVSAKLGPLRVRGFIGFDALVRFEPFSFLVSFQAGMRVQWRGRNLTGITVSGTLSGPGPVVFAGRACVEVLFFDVCAGASFELGSDAPPAVAPPPNVLDTMQRELRDPGNLRAVADDPAVVLRPLPPPSATTPPVLAATGLVWEQKRAPLGLLLERFEGSTLGRAQAVEVLGEDVSGDERDWFAPGGFAELTDAEALTRRSFERLRSGVRIAAGHESSQGVPHLVDVQEFRVPQPAGRPVPPGRGQQALEVPEWMAEAVLVREGRGAPRRAEPVIATRPEAWQVLDGDGRPLATVDEAAAHQLVRTHARAAVAVPAGDVVALAEL